MHLCLIKYLSLSLSLLLCAQEPYCCVPGSRTVVCPGPVLLCARRDTEPNVSYFYHSSIMDFLSVNKHSLGCAIIVQDNT